MGGRAHGPHLSRRRTGTGRSGRPGLRGGSSWRRKTRPAGCGVRAGSLVRLRQGQRGGGGGGAGLGHGHSSFLGSLAALHPLLWGDSAGGLQGPSEPRLWASQSGREAGSRRRCVSSTPCWLTSGRASSCARRPVAEGTRPQTPRGTRHLVRPSPASLSPLASRHPRAMPSLQPGASLPPRSPP